MRRKLAVLPFLVVVFVFLTSPAFAEFWGSKNSNKYHYPTCRWAQKINPANLVKFATPEAAAKANYVPCKVCRPPSVSRLEINPEVGFGITFANFIIDEDNPAKRGCCSWHGGVCGCENGRVVCCDGTYSKSCSCAR